MPIMFLGLVAKLNGYRKFEPITTENWIELFMHWPKHRYTATLDGLKHDKPVKKAQKIINIFKTVKFLSELSIKTVQLLKHDHTVVQKSRRQQSSAFGPFHLLLAKQKTK